jgi:GAF domain-containing protein
VPKAGTGRGRLPLLSGARLDPVTWRILVLVVLMVAAASAMATYVLPAVALPPHERWIPWWALGLLFAAAEVFVLHMQVRREARTISLSDIPLVLGLFLATPGALLVGRLLLPTLVFAFVRRQPLIKLLFNIALQAVETMTAVVVFGVVASTGDLDGPVGWAAAYLAAAAGGLLSAGLVSTVIALYEKRARWRAFVAAASSGVTVALMVATAAVISVEALRADRRAVGLLAVCASVVFFAYRAYASLHERHEGLERIYEFSRVVGGSPETNDVIRAVLTEARDLLRAERAELSLLDVDVAEGWLRVASTSTTPFEQIQADDLEPGDWLWARAVEGEDPLLMPRNTRDQAVRRYLDRRGWREAIVVPMRGESGIVGTLAVADRMGDVRTFDTGDVQLLATVANHASVALQNGRLFDRLRHDALHDTLTQLPNRVGFQHAVTQALEARAETRSVAVMTLDLDGLQEINDTVGHDYGDGVIAELAQRLT